MDHHQFLGWITILLLAVGLQAGHPQAGAALLCTDPARLEIGAGQIETLQILLENADEIYGIDLQASFDPAVVEVVDADSGQTGAQMAPGVFLRPDFIVRNLVDNQTGRLHYVITQLAPTPPASGKGNLLSIRFQGKASGTHSKFIITSAVIADRRGVKQPLTTRGADLVIVKVKPPTLTPHPTRTSIPSKTARPTATLTLTRTQPTAPPSMTVTRHASPMQTEAAAGRNNPPVQRGATIALKTPARLVESHLTVSDQALTNITVCGFSGALLFLGLTVLRLAAKRRKNLSGKDVCGEGSDVEFGEGDPGTDDQERAE